MKKNIVALIIIIAVFSSTYFSGCSDDSVSPVNSTNPTSSLTNSYSSDVALQWYNLEIKLIKQTSGITPPVASRALGYTGIALYESVVPGMPEYQSLKGQLNDLTSLPEINSADEYNWPTSANAALANIIRKLYFNASAQNMASVDSLENAFNTTYQSQVSSDVFLRSKNFGESIAASVYSWSVTDGGNEGQLHNTDPGYVPPVGTGFWVPTPPTFAPAVQPYWGNNRPFITANVTSCQPGPHTPFSTSNTSLFYTQALEVYSTFNKLTDDQKNIAYFWADGGGTYTPPGHSVAILMQLLNSKNSKLDFTAASLAKIGIAVSDAFISCWKGKFTYNLLRPITYIRNYIDPAWSPLLTTPPFPEYASGHSTQSGASAQVLSDILGYNYSFTDYTHSGDGFAPRSFNSFFNFASEAAISRLYGGIHYRAANENGLEKGIEIGRNVSALHFLK